MNYIGNEREDCFFERNKGVKYLIGIGDNRIREKIYNLIIEKEGEILILISQSASISKTASIGTGTFVNKMFPSMPLLKLKKMPS